MPQASDELRKEWNGPDDTTARAYLKERGYILTDHWCWLIPDGMTPTEKDISAVSFMVDEWDYGGFLRASVGKPVSG